MAKKYKDNLPYKGIFLFNLSFVLFPDTKTAGEWKKKTRNQLLPFENLYKVPQHNPVSSQSPVLSTSVHSAEVFQTRTCFIRAYRSTVQT